LRGIQYCRGSTARRRSSVFSGERVRTTPSRFEIRCTWVSTGIAGMPYPNTSTQFAVFAPTHGSEVSSSNRCGTDPPNRVRISLAHARIARALVR